MSIQDIAMWQVKGRGCAYCLAPATGWTLNSTGDWWPCCDEHAAGTYMAPPPAFPVDTIADIQDQVLAEIERAEKKFGNQFELPDGAGDDKAFFPAGIQRNGRYATMGTLCYVARDVTNDHARDGFLTWSDILLEEVFEACCEDSTERLRTELIQVAAVAMRWIDAIDNRQVTS